MYGVKFSCGSLVAIGERALQLSLTVSIQCHPLTGAVGPQAVASRHLSTRLLAGGRLGAGIDVHRHNRISASINVSLTTAILAPTVQVLENSKTWISIIICSLIRACQI